jgi:hypothetical protein
LVYPLALNLCYQHDPQLLIHSILRFSCPPLIHHAL